MDPSDVVGKEHWRIVDTAGLKDNTHTPSLLVPIHHFFDRFIHSSSVLTFFARFLLLDNLSAKLLSSCDRPRSYCRADVTSVLPSKSISTSITILNNDDNGASRRVVQQPSQEVQVCSI